MLAKDIASLVPMPRLLGELGFRVNERSHRSSCPLHSGKNLSAFSWRDDGVWYCFSCGRGGDKFSLVQQARSCDFKDALRFLAALAGVNLDDGESPKFRADLARARRERKQREFEEARLKAIERRAFLEARDDVLVELERLRRNAGRRLAVLLDGPDHERFAGETEFVWEALKLVAEQMPRAASAFTVISFADQRSRTDFSLRSECRAALVDGCLEDGGACNDRQHFVGMVL